MCIGCWGAGHADSVQLVGRRQVASVQTVVCRGDLREQGCQQTEKLVRVVGVDVDCWFWIRAYGRSTSLCGFWCIITVVRMVSVTILRRIGSKVMRGGRLVM